MAFQQSDLEAVERAIASGELSVSHNGRTVTYRSLADLLKARELISRALAGPARGGLDASSFRLARFD